MLNLTSILHGLTTVNTSVIDVNVEVEPTALILQLIVTGAFFLLMLKYVWPKLKGSIVDRAAYINETLDDAEAKQAEAVDTKSKYEAELNEVKSTKKDIFAAAAKEANKQKDITIQESKIRGREIIEKSKVDAEQSKVLIEEQIQKEMMEYVNEVAAKFISEKISSEEELKMIEDAVEGLR